MNLLAGVPSEWDLPTLVVNDESVPLHEFVRSLVGMRRVRALHLARQVGKAEAIRSGIDFICANHDVDVIVQIDVRGKQPPEDSRQVVDRLRSTGADMVIGTRYELQSLDAQVHRRAVSNLFARIVESATGNSYSDIACGMRAYRSDLGARFARIRSFGYGLEIEQLLIAAIEGRRVESCPVRSNRQENATNAEKLEDNIYALLIYAGELRVSSAIRVELHRMLLRVKRRESFEVELAALWPSAEGQVVRFVYLPGNSDIVGAYTNQSIADAYALVAEQREASVR